MATVDLTAQRLRELLHYNSETGLFTWRGNRTGFALAGTVAGTKSGGYICIQVDGTLYRAHRLAWLYVNECWPEFVIDHINGDKTDNRLCNLRDVDETTNAHNRKRAHKNSSSGALGVSRIGNRWRALIRVNGKRIHIGCFGSIDEASAAYFEAKAVLHRA